jgi:ribosome-associated translation inhibitor RaiA/cold shock CspA family protein
MELHWHHPEAFREQDRRAAEERIAELARDHSDLIDVRIAARITGHHQHGGQEVRITCEARGKELVASRSAADPGLALNEAVEVFEREVRRMRRRRAQKRVERPPVPPELGVVDEIRRDQDCGFILSDGGDRIYFHRNAVRGGLVFERLEEGQRVGLNIEGGVQGPQATVVVAPPPDVSTP